MQNYYCKHVVILLLIIHLIWLEDLEEDIILLENDFDIYVYISKIANDSDSDGIKTEDFVLVGGHLDVYNALSEMTDDSVNVFNFKEYKFD